MSAADVTAVHTGAGHVSRQTVVDAPAGEIFALVADPHRHGELDGSGTVQATVSGPQRLSEGAKFSVGMKQLGVPYRITSTVTQFVPDQLVEWRHPLGHRWRWQLLPLAAGRTQVTETFDYSGTGVRGKLLELSRTPARNARGIENTLLKLRDRFTA